MRSFIEVWDMSVMKNQARYVEINLSSYDHI